MTRTLPPCLLVLACLCASPAFADEPLALRNSWRGNIDYFMTGAAFAYPNAAGNNAAGILSSVDIVVPGNAVPGSASLLKAYLYWGGSQAQPSTGPCTTATDVPDSAVYLTPPGGARGQVSATVCYCADGQSSSIDEWICRADITPKIQAAGGTMTGTFTVDGYTGKADGGGTDNAGAALVLVYQGPTLTPRQVALYDGNITLYMSSALIHLDGIEVDTSPVAKLTYFSLEAEAATIGDSATVDGSPGPAGPITLTDNLNPANDLMNRTINTTSPPQLGVMGVDIDQFDISAALSARDTSVDVNLVVQGDKIWLAVNVLGVALYDPNLVESHKSWQLQDDVDGDGAVDVGDTVRYTITLVNTGNEPATADVADTIPAQAASWAMVAASSGTDASDTTTVRVQGVQVPASGGTATIVFDVVVADVNDQSTMRNTFSWSAPVEGGSPGQATAPAVVLRRDRDGDSIHDNDDNCPGTANPQQEDSDGDGIGDACSGCPDEDGDLFTAASCGGGDCDDLDSAVHPGGVDLCNGKDDDCNVLTLDGSAEVWLGEACDGDDVDECIEGISLCNGGLRACSDLTDDDLEVCDGIDNDCDGYMPKDEQVFVQGHLRCEFTEDPDGDLDGDGLTNRQELLFGTSPALADSDEDGVDDFIETNGGTELVDSDQDGLADAVDTDDDGDGIPTRVEGMFVEDPDGDLVPNRLDIDSDGDGISDNTEAGIDPQDPADTDGDELPDFLDLDSDGDSVNDDVDNCRYVPNPDQTDRDGNGRGDVCADEDCHDGIDNNENGQIDCADVLCADRSLCLEICGNELDDDGNGLIDCEDPDCAQTSACIEVCDNGDDDDMDGLADCEDSDCALSPACLPVPDVQPDTETDVAEADGGEAAMGSKSDCSCRVAVQRRAVGLWGVVLLGLVVWVRRRR